MNINNYNFEGFDVGDKIETDKVNARDSVFYVRFRVSLRSPSSPCSTVSFKRMQEVATKAGLLAKEKRSRGEIKTREARVGTKGSY